MTEKMHSHIDPRTGKPYPMFAGAPDLERINDCMKAAEQEMPWDPMADKYFPHLKRPVTR